MGGCSGDREDMRTATWVAVFEEVWGGCQDIWGIGCLDSFVGLNYLLALLRPYIHLPCANPATVPGVKLVRLVKLVKLVTLSIGNQTKIDQHRPQNRPKIDPKSARFWIAQDRPKIDQDRPKIELGWGLGAIWAPRCFQEPT